MPGLNLSEALKQQITQNGPSSFRSSVIKGATARTVLEPGPYRQLNKRRIFIKKRGIKTKLKTPKIANSQPPNFISAKSSNPLIEKI